MFWITTVITAAGGAVIGWQARALITERRMFRRAARRDAAWDQAHGIPSDRRCGVEQRGSSAGS